MTDAPEPPRTPEGAAPAEAGAESTGFAGGYRVQLPSFEGPLDLLLHLIEEHELDIRDIPIAFVAAKYVEYITLMEELNIDIASEYLVMAATLTHIKSKMLLPVPPQDQDDESQEAELDPRAELVRRLLEYQKYKNAAETLAGGPVLGRDVFQRGLPAPSVEGPAPIAGLSLFKLLDAFQAVLARAKTTVEHQIDFERFSITDRINELSDVLRQRRSVVFEELFEEQRTRADLIITFLALLEMTKLRMTRLVQAGPLEPITIELAVTDEGEGEGEAEGARAPAAEELEERRYDSEGDAPARPPARDREPDMDEAESFDPDFDLDEEPGDDALPGTEQD